MIGSLVFPGVCSKIQIPFEVFNRSLSFGEKLSKSQLLLMAVAELSGHKGHTCGQALVFRHCGGGPEQCCQ